MTAHGQPLILSMVIVAALVCACGDRSSTGAKERLDKMLAGKPVLERGSTSIATPEGNVNIQTATTPATPQGLVPLSADAKSVRFAKMPPASPTSSRPSRREACRARTGRCSRKDFLGFPFATVAKRIEAKEFAFFTPVFRVLEHNAATAPPLQATTPRRRQFAESSDLSGEALSELRQAAAFGVSLTPSALITLSTVPKLGLPLFASAL
jgi:hypothetical protein